MGTRRREDGPGRVFHVTARVNWRAWHLDDDRTKMALARLLAAAATEFDVSLLAFALMANHFHAVVCSPQPLVFHRLTSRRTSCRHRRPWPTGHQNASVLAQFMRKVRSGMSRARQSQLGLSGRFWEGEYDARLVPHPDSLIIRIAYDHRNPVKVGIVGQPEEYEWSSARQWASGEDGKIPLALDRPLPFGLQTERLRREVLRYQRARWLDSVSNLDHVLRGHRERPGELEALLESAGVPIPNAAPVPQDTNSTH